MIEKQIGIHPEVVAWTLSQLNDQERVDFAAEVRPLLKRLLRLDAAGSGDELVHLGKELAACLEAWRISLTLHADPDWHAQVDASAQAWREGDRATLSVGDLRDALSI